MFKSLTGNCKMSSYHGWNCTLIWRDPVLGLQPDGPTKKPGLARDCETGKGCFQYGRHERIITSMVSSRPSYGGMPSCYGQDNDVMIFAGIVTASLSGKEAPIFGYPPMQDHQGWHRLHRLAYEAVVPIVDPSAASDRSDRAHMFSLTAPELSIGSAQASAGRATSGISRSSQSASVHVRSTLRYR